MIAALLALVILLPLAMLAGCLWTPLRQAMPALLPIAPIPGLASALLCRGGTASLAGIPLRLSQELPAPALLGAASVLWIVASLMVVGSIADRGRLERFSAWWLLTLTGSLGVFIAADLIGFYLLYSVVSLCAYGLLAAEARPGSGRAISVYMSLAVLGEAFLLLAFVLLYGASSTGSLLISDVVAALPRSPWRDVTIACLILGFGLKIGLVPGHVWMPLAYPLAPLPAAAALSGAAVKSGVIGLILFLPFGTTLPGWGSALAIVGFASALYGVLVGVTQDDPRSVLAYSSISQMGLVAALCGLGLSSGDAAAPGAVAFYAVHHLFVKGGLFVALALLAASAPAQRRGLILPIAFIALGLAGLPLTGGYLAKYAIKPDLGDGLAGMMGMVSSAGSTILMLHFVRILRRGRYGTASALPRATKAWWTLAAAATALPWLLLRPMTGLLPSAALSPLAIVEMLGPVLAGALVAVLLSRSNLEPPPIPPGDVLTGFDRLAPAGRWIFSATAEGDAFLMRWPVAGIALLLIALLLGAALATAG